LVVDYPISRSRYLTPIIIIRLQLLCAIPRSHIIPPADGPGALSLRAVYKTTTITIITYNNITTIIIISSRTAVVGRYFIISIGDNFFFFRSREPVWLGSCLSLWCMWPIIRLVFRPPLQSDTISSYYLLLVIFSTWLRDDDDDDDDDIPMYISCFIKTFYTNFTPTVVFISSPIIWKYYVPT